MICFLAFLHQSRYFLLPFGTFKFCWWVSSFLLVVLELRSTPNYSKQMKYFLKVSFLNQSFLLKGTMTACLGTRNLRTAEKFSFGPLVIDRCLKFFLKEWMSRVLQIVILHSHGWLSVFHWVCSSTSNIFNLLAYKMEILIIDLYLFFMQKTGRFWW